MHMYSPRRDIDTCVRHTQLQHADHCAGCGLAGHEMEIVCTAFNPQSTLVATGSMDHTARVSLIKPWVHATTSIVNSFRLSSGGNCI
jgi:hypothetical protein